MLMMKISSTRTSLVCIHFSNPQDYLKSANVQSQDNLKKVNFCLVRIFIIKKLHQKSSVVSLATLFCFIWLLFAMLRDSSASSKNQTHKKLFSPPLCKTKKKFSVWAELVNALTTVSSYANCRSVVCANKENAVSVQPEQKKAIVKRSLMKMLHLAHQYLSASTCIWQVLKRVCTYTYTRKTWGSYLWCLILP